MVLLIALAAAVQAPPPPDPAAQDRRTAFCWAALTNAAMRTMASTGRMPEGTLAEALPWINGKLRGRYPEDARLVIAMRAGAEAFASTDINQSAADCLREFGEEMARFTELSMQSMR